MKSQRHHSQAQAGFTLTEMMVSILILTVIVGAIFSQVNVAQQRSYTERMKLDDFQEARDFVDQFFRDINQIGYPNVRLIDTTQVFSPALASPLINDSRLAIGLVKIAQDEIRFEGDTNGSGTVQSIRYVVNGSGTCALCLQRSQADKVAGDPLNNQVQNWGTEVNDVTSTQIFTYYDTNGVKITALPADTSTAAGKQTLASVKTIQISLTIQNNAVLDPASRQPIQTNLEGEVSLNNCSMATSGQPMSCQ